MHYRKVLEISLLVMIIVYFIGFISLHPGSVFLKESPIPIPSGYEIHFEILLWIIFSLLVLDLYLKFKEKKDWRLFLKKHWHEIIMLILIPIFTVFKIAKLSVHLIKSLKVSKTGFKVFYKAKKISK